MTRRDTGQVSSRLFPPSVTAVPVLPGPGRPLIPASVTAIAVLGMPSPQPVTAAQIITGYDLYDWYYQDSYGVSASGAQYPRQDARHGGTPVQMTALTPGGWVIPAAGAALLILADGDALGDEGGGFVDGEDGTGLGEEDAAAVIVGLPVNTDDGLDVGARILAVAPGGTGLLPVPPSVYGYEPLPVVFQGAGSVAYLTWR